MKKRGKVKSGGGKWMLPKPRAKRAVPDGVATRLWNVGMLGI
jgi:hypothetical protein